ncbi:MAG TPA: hypothetical protein VFA41_01545 [Ktedonobacteraceae bacterium]|jgi:DNA-directed RNA polymerase subunit RPC12/RpoP|nr:hypothetical protein [Ktedonobacteraceae bacterium]
MEAAGPQVQCPYCGSTQTEFFSLFGQQLLTVQYYCTACHTPFECVKDDDILDAYVQQHSAGSAAEVEPLQRMRKEG